MEYVYTPKQDYKVLVRCFTYNQSKYIEDSLNGFAMQKTNYPFVCLVMDDCSTDGEQDVIKTWMERECDMGKAEYVDLELSNVILVPHKTNENCTFAVYLLKQNLYSDKVTKMSLVEPWRVHCEYEALCEGDDYWIVEEKLQKQADFMDCHADYSMCFTNATIYYEVSGKKRPFVIDFPVDRDFSGTDIYRFWTVPTASVIHRTSIFETDLHKKVITDKRFIYGDIRLFLTCAGVGKVRGMKTPSCVYRKNAGSAVYSRSANQMLKELRQSDAIAEIFGSEYLMIVRQKRPRSCARGIYKCMFTRKFTLIPTFISMGKKVSLIKTCYQMLVYPMERLFGDKTAQSER